jgi:tetratricopeptide (TPR) repeat protein
MQRPPEDVFADARHDLSCSKFKEALELFEEVVRCAPRYSVLWFEAKRQIPVIWRLLGVSYETTCEKFLEIIAEARRERCEFIDALTLRDLARLHMSYNLMDDARRCLDESNQIIDEALKTGRNFNWLEPFAWRRMVTERAINYGLQGLMNSNLALIIWCELMLRHADVMYRDARLDNLIAILDGSELLRRSSLPCSAPRLVTVSRQDTCERSEEVLPVLQRSTLCGTHIPLNICINL